MLEASSNFGTSVYPFFTALESAKVLMYDAVEKGYTVSSTSTLTTGTD